MSKRRRRCGKTKSRSQEVHTRRRFRDRYGLHVSASDIEDMVRQIQSGQARHVEAQTNRVSVWDVTVRGQLARVVYDAKRKTLATALHPELIERDKQREEAKQI